MKPVPLLVLTDSPDQPSGLARIGRDLAGRVHRHLSERFRVGYLGRGGMGGDFPYPTWIIPHSLYGQKTTTEWGSSVLPQVWQAFAGEEEGIVFSIWDAARLIWLTQPKYLQDSPATDFLTNAPFKKWIYCPVDGASPSGGLGLMGSEALKGFDRVLAYTPYGAKVIAKAMGSPVPPQWIPHGLDPLWSPRDKKASREYFNIPQNAFVVGVVATNSKRKDWGLAGAIGQHLKDYFEQKNRPYHQWWHIDRAEKDWSIPAVCNEFGLEECTMVTLSPQSDDWLAAAYSCCDVTLAIGAGEGFGYPIVESQACGVPVVHGNYAGGACFVPKSNLVDEPAGFYLDGLTNIKRPVYGHGDWVMKILGGNLQVGDMAPLRWPLVWPQWKQWFLEGIQ